MRRLALGMWWIALSGFAWAQASPASMSGVVIAPAGTRVADAPIQVRNAQGEQVGRTVTGADGRYTIASLPPGVYTISVAIPCCAIRSFTRRDVRLNAGQLLQFDIHLEPGASQNTLGDDPATIADAIRRRSRIPAKPVPRLANGKPSVAGVWLVNQDRYPEEPLPLPWAAGVQKQRTATDSLLSLNARCLPNTVPTPSGGATPFIVKLVQQPSLMLVLFEGPPGFRQVFLDGRAHPADPNPTWLGHSIGKWDGDALVVDTVGYNEESWIVGSYPHTEMLHVVERYRRPDFAHLQIDVTYEDPGTFTKPVTRHSVWDLAPDEELLEFVCENNKEGRVPTTAAGGH